MNTRTYQSPQLEQLKKGIQDLAKSNSERKDTVQKLIKLANTISDSRTLIGAVLFEIESIGLEYRWVGSPENCRLYNALNGVLSINEQTPISEEERLCYLYCYLEYCQSGENKPASQTASESKNECKDLKDQKGTPASDTKDNKSDQTFPPVVDAILRRIPNLNFVLTQRPDLERLTALVATVPEKYAKTCSKRWTNPNADHQKKFIIYKILIYNSSG